jgi:hypothetical protein
MFGHFNILCDLCKPKEKGVPGTAKAGGIDRKAGKDRGIFIFP